MTIKARVILEFEGTKTTFSVDFTDYDEALNALLGAHRLKAVRVECDRHVTQPLSHQRWEIG